MIFSLRGRTGGAQAEVEPSGVAPAIRAAEGGSTRPYIADDMAVRRLTPTECERLQGFEDGHTAGQADGPRYKQLGNSFPVPVVRWIGEQIMVADLF